MGRKMDRRLLLCLALGWMCEAARGSVWASYSWGHQDDEPLPLSRPSNGKEPQLLYAVWETPPLLLKEGITSEEAAWIPGEEPLEAIKESYASGSREFDNSFGRSFDEFSTSVLENLSLKSSPPQYIDTHTSKPPTARHPRHYPALIDYTPPRKFYLTGVIEEIKQTRPQTAPDVRKYYLGREAGSDPTHRAPPAEELNEIQVKNSHSVTLTPTSSPQTLPLTMQTEEGSEETRTSKNHETVSTVTKKPQHQHRPTHHPPTSYGHPPPYPPLPPHYPPYRRLHRPHHYPHHKYHISPVPLRKYFLKASNPTLSSSLPPATSPPVSITTSDPKEEKTVAPEPKSLEVYEKIRQPRLVSTAWVSTSFLG